MGPTIKDEELHFSQNKAKENRVEFTVEIKGCENIVSILEKEHPGLLKATKTIHSH